MLSVCWSDPADFHVGKLQASCPGNYILEYLVDYGPVLFFLGIDVPNLDFF